MLFDPAYHDSLYVGFQGWRKSKSQIPNHNNQHAARAPALRVAETVQTNKCERTL